MAKKKNKTTAIRLSDRVGRPQRVQTMRARYDAAQTTDENRRHFAAVDAYSPDEANNLGVRTVLRNRGRYVFANNSRVKGMIGTLANHTVGTGPRLQMQLGDGKQARKLSSQIESDFSSWAKQINLARKLRTLRIARAISGEIFLVMGINPELNHRVKLDVRLVETDRISNPRYSFADDDIDGIFLDSYDNPVSYRILRTHPGDMFRALVEDDYDDFPARIVLHYFNQERPEQHRGIPDITPAIQLFEEGRRFRAAVLAASETAADFAMVIQSDAAASQEAAETDPMDEFELKRRMATVLPHGWKLAQTKPEQPTTGYKEFGREIVSEAARCIHMPLSLATLDANDANMSSSYVINQPYESAIFVDRSDIDARILDPILDAYLTLAFDPTGSPISRRMPDEFPHNFYWPLIGNHADPMKVANGQSIRLEKNLTTLMREYAREGLDWEAELTQRSKEIKLQKQLGLTDQQALPALKKPGDTNNEAPTDEQVSADD